MVVRDYALLGCFCGVTGHRRALPNWLACDQDFEREAVGITSAHSLSGQRDADDQYRYAATCINNQLENTMLLLILIGATLSFERPEPRVLASVPGDQVRFHREAWRCPIGVAAFWR